MAERYRKHLILEKTSLNSKTGLWNVRARVQFNENGTFYDVLIPDSTHSFAIEGDAVKYILAAAKKWVDKRLLQSGGE
jgi:hypothetical protein